MGVACTLRAPPVPRRSQNLLTEGHVWSLVREAKLEGDVAVCSSAGIQIHVAPAT